MFRSPKLQRAYRRVHVPQGCAFCDDQDLTNRIVFETPDAYVIPNLFPYSMWDMRRVIEHLMIIPKQHVKSLSELSAEARTSIMDLAADYEAKGYNVYARATDSTARTVAHQHTHLIRTEGTPHKVSFYWRKPYISFHL